jgi:ABC-type amino acid transport substrate-binding protein
MMRLSKLILFFAATIFAAAGSANGQQIFRVGLMDAEPGVIRDNGQLGGRDIDIWDALAKDIGLRVTYVLVSSPAALLAALDEGKVDVAGWAVTRNPINEAKYLLTDTIFPTAEALLVPKSDTQMYRGLDDIKGLKFATLS